MKTIVTRLFKRPPPCYNCEKSNHCGNCSCC
jgi:hypothetical protein